MSLLSETSDEENTRDVEAMALSRVLKLDLILLIIVIAVIAASSYAIYAGNRRFIGIIGIAALALALVLWRIFTLSRQTDVGSEPERLNIDFDLDSIQKMHPPRK